MATIIRNKLTIIPNSNTPENYSKQINDVAKFCEIIENDVRKSISFEKITPKPIFLSNETKEEDNWLLKNWGTRFKALNSCWVSDYEMIFDTCWNPAIPIFFKIAKHFNNTDFNFKFASKRIGLKTGEISSSKGKIILFNKFNNYSKEAYETAFELMPHATIEYTYNQKKGTYEYDTSDFKREIEQKGFYKGTDGTVLIGSDDKQKPLFDGVNDLPF